MKKEYYLESQSKNHKLYMLAYVPKGKIKGYIQILHDMYDYISRYQSFMEYLCSNGYLCFGFDMPGHGKSADKGLGNMDDYNSEQLIDDLHEAYLKILKDNIPDLSPIKFIDKSGKQRFFVKPQIHTLLSIGIGAAIVREYTKKYRDANNLIVIGDYGFNPRYSTLLEKVSKQEKTLGSNTHLIDIREELLCDNDEKGGRNSYRLSGINQVKKLNDDKNLNFEYDNKSMKLMLMLLSKCNIDQWLTFANKSMPIYEMAGYEDPLSRYTRDIDSIVIRFKYEGFKNFSHKYYDKAKHDILFENMLAVREDVFAFIETFREQLIKIYNEEKENVMKGGN